MSREEDRCLIAESLLFRLMANQRAMDELYWMDREMVEDLERWARFVLHCTQGGTQSWTDFE